jgi:hypothetical protein
MTAKWLAPCTISHDGLSFSIYHGGKTEPAVSFTLPPDAPGLARLLDYAVFGLSVAFKYEDGNIVIERFNPLRHETTIFGAMEIKGDLTGLFEEK